MNILLKFVMNKYKEGAYMIERDVYELKESDEFSLNAYQEKTVDLQLKKAPPICNTLLVGKVFSRYCKPIANATVKIFDCNLEPLLHTLTDACGVYKFKDTLSPGKYKVVASAENYLASKVRTIAIYKEFTSKLDFNLLTNPIVQRGIIYGTVYDNYKGSPIGNAKITLITKDGFPKTVAATLTNSKGQYIIYNLLLNNYNLEVTCPEYLSSESVNIPVGKQNISLMNISLIRDNSISNGTISGIIRYKGTHVVDIPVFLYSYDKDSFYKLQQEQMTNDQGLYLFSSVAPGKYMINAKLQNGREICEDIIIKENEKVEKNLDGSGL